MSLRLRTSSSTMRMLAAGSCTSVLVDSEHFARRRGELRVQRPEQILVADRLGDVSIAASRVDALGISLHGQRGECDNRNVARGRIGFDLAGGRQAVHA